VWERQLRCLGYLEGVFSIIGTLFSVITVNESDDPALSQAVSMQCWSWCSFPSPYAEPAPFRGKRRKEMFYKRKVMCHLFS